ncbi:hypothetical protein [Undibacterium sp.]|jgi:hypothetical protein|uniref:hypothetical protein n=1 Tax=Undibacterium sp. TaxID=1914977 RepID=UPI0025F97A7C|nr:hypothetical protein [Undibacterium sp.]
MSYHVSIIRTSNPIGTAEVAAAVTLMPAWKFDETRVEATCSIDIDAKQTLTVWLQDGELWTKNPSELAIIEMLKLAQQLNARVRGDEFETYRTATETYNHPDDDELKKAAELEIQSIVRGTKKRQWLLNAIILGFFIALALVAKNCSGA